jgi:uncharacterized protein YgiB involved in biofilm formation
MTNRTNRRKRSQIAGFTAVGMLGMLSACGSSETPASPEAAKPQGETQSTYVYRSVAQCVKEGSFSKAKCEEGYAAALAEKDAGKNYTTKQECEAEYGEGNCETRRGGRFGGFLAGYFIGRSSDGSKYSYSGLYNDRKTGGLVTGSKSWLSNGKPTQYSIASNDFTRKTSASQPTAREKTRLAIAARGGFGSGGSAAVGKSSIGGSKGG